MRSIVAMQVCESGDAHVLLPEVSRLPMGAIETLSRAFWLPLFGGSKTALLQIDRRIRVRRGCAPSQARGHRSRSTLAARIFFRTTSWSFTVAGATWFIATAIGLVDGRPSAAHGLTFANPLALVTELDMSGLALLFVCVLCLTTAGHNAIPISLFARCDLRRTLRRGRRVSLDGKNFHRPLVPFVECDAQKACRSINWQITYKRSVFPS